MLNFFNDESSEQGKCPQEITCTHSDDEITIRITDSEGNALELDEHLTFIKESGKIFSFGKGDEKGIYTLITNNEMDEVRRSGSKIVFKGAYDGHRIVKEYIIGHNCCCVEMVSGTEFITLYKPNN